MRPQTMKRGVMSVCHGRMHSGRRRSPGSRRICARLALIQKESTLVSEGNRAPFKYPVDSFTILVQPCLALSCQPGQRHASSQSRCKQAVPNDPCRHSRCNMCPDFFSGCCKSGHHCFHNASILTKLSRTCSTGVEVLETATHHRYMRSACAAYIHPYSRSPTMRPR